MNKVIAISLVNSDQGFGYLMAVGISVVEYSHETKESKTIAQWQYFTQKPTNDDYDEENVDLMKETESGRDFLARWEFRPVNL